MCLGRRGAILICPALTGGIRPYAPRHTQYDAWYEGIPRGKQGHTRMRCGHNVE